ncbi:hypothetical protein PAPYR_12811 [Paratrimastix pyriformis]|uniref:Uncharacterized protein n=1 Tax=Paratrimastix pyriformis TaxID=342808 RepID=A0ABQ8U1A4_9EUKA|nr:hypothetical protein PAPYR_12811 [Paratrimastix pyriformis]
MLFRAPQAHPRPAPRAAACLPARPMVPSPRAITAPPSCTPPRHAWCGSPRPDQSASTPTGGYPRHPGVEEWLSPLDSGLLSASPREASPTPGAGALGTGIYTRRQAGGMGALAGAVAVPVQHDPLRPTGRPGADKGPCEVATTGPAPADPQQERLKNRVIAAFQMQQLVEELAQREQAASDAAARCRDLEAASRRETRSEARAACGAPGRGSAACEGLIGTLQAATAALSQVAHSDAALTIKRSSSRSRDI